MVRTYICSAAFVYPRLSRVRESRRIKDRHTRALLRLPPSLSLSFSLSLDLRLSRAISRSRLRPGISRSHYALNDGFWQIACAAKSSNRSFYDAVRSSFSLSLSLSLSLSPFVRSNARTCNLYLVLGFEARPRITPRAVMCTRVTPRECCHS